MRYIWMYGVIHRIRHMKSKRKKQPLGLGKHLTNLVPGSSAIRLQAGQAIFCQGDAADAVYYIRRGTVSRGGSSVRYRTLKCSERDIFPLCLC